MSGGRLGVRDVLSVDHFLIMVLYALLLSMFLAVLWASDRPCAFVSSRIFGALVIGGLAVAWLMYPFLPEEDGSAVGRRGPNSEVDARCLVYSAALEPLDRRGFRRPAWARLLGRSGASSRPDGVQWEDRGGRGPLLRCARWELSVMGFAEVLEHHRRRSDLSRRASSGCPAGAV
jgi:hypothetical protein